MINIKVAALALAGVLLARAAAAQVAAAGAGLPIPPAPPAYTGPGDVVAGATAAYLLRAYTQAQATAGTQALLNLRNTSGNETCDLIVATDGSLVNGTMSNCSGSSNGSLPDKFCRAGCAVKTWYDASGNGNDITQATTANQPTLVFNCTGGLPCVQYTSASITLSKAYTPSSATMTLSLVADRTTGTGVAGLKAAGTGNNNKIVGGAANVWTFTGAASGTISPAATDNAWHAANGVINGVSSAINIDGTETTGTTTGSTAANSLVTVGAASTTLRIAESLVYGSTVFNGTQRTNMCNNQRLYWGSGGSC